MAVVVPNQPSASYEVQSQLDSLDFQQLGQMIQRNTGVIRGYTITVPTTGTARTITVAPGLCVVNGVHTCRRSASSQNLTAPAAHATLDRIDIITVSSVGDAVYTSGTAAIVPVMPSPGVNCLLAAVYIPAASTGRILATQITDKSIKFANDHTAFDVFEDFTTPGQQYTQQAINSSSTQYRMFQSNVPMFTLICLNTYPNIPYSYVDTNNPNGVLRVNAASDNATTAAITTAPPMNATSSLRPFGKLVNRIVFRVRRTNANVSFQLGLGSVDFSGNGSGDRFSCFSSTNAGSSSSLVQQNAGSNSSSGISSPLIPINTWTIIELVVHADRTFSFLQNGTFYGTFANSATPTAFCTWPFIRVMSSNSNSNNGVREDRPLEIDYIGIKFFE